MSIKSTLAYGDNFHLYEEVLDEDNIFLSIDNVAFSATNDGISVKIPLEIWAVIRQYGEPDTQYAGWSDDDVKQYATKEVNDRINGYYETAKEEGEAIASLKYLYGSVVYGNVTDPKEEQINRTIEYVKKLRDIHNKIHNAIAKAKNDNTPLFE